MITREQLDEMFAQMRADAPFNVDGDLLWGYFFTDEVPEKLYPVAEHLEKRGFTVVSVHPMDGGEMHMLHAECVQTHNPETLDHLNQEFYRLAEEHGIASYDGMDVGPAPEVHES